MLKAPVNQNKDFEPAPAGNHIARLYKIVHVGTIQDTYEGKPREINKIALTFELSSELHQFREGEPDRPWSVSREFTFSMGEKANLRKMVEGMIGVALQDEEATSFNIEDLLGKACLLNVVHKKNTVGKTYAQIAGASPLPKGLQAPQQYNKGVILDYEENWNEEVFKSLPQYIQEKMVGSYEYRQKYLKEPSKEITPDDIPF